MKRTSRGFTLLEVMVATLVMGIAVVGVLSGLSVSTRNAARLSAYDRAVMLSRAKMDELLTDRHIPFGATIQGQFDANSGWGARFSAFDVPVGARPGMPVMERVELEIWWMSGSERRTFPLEGYRRSFLPVGGI